MSEETQEKVSVVGTPNLIPKVEDIKEEEVDVDAIVGELEDDIEEEEKVETDAPTSEQPAPAIDIASLTLEQVQELAARMAAAPTRADARTKGQEIKLKMFQGKIIIDFKNAYIGLMDDYENQRKVERHIIPILLEGDKEYVNMPYRQFMQLEQVSCEMLNERSEEDRIVKGTTYNEHDELVEMVVIKKKYFFTVKTPDGRKLEIEGKIANG